MSLTNFGEGLSRSALSKLIGVDRSSLNPWFLLMKKGDTKNLTEPLKPFTGKTFSGDIPPSLCKAFIEHYAFYAVHPKKNAQELLGFKNVLNVKPVEKKTKAVSKEIFYAKKLAKLLGGEREKLTPGGNIDVLTDTEVIELKEVRGWKEGLGQLLVYGYYYPNRKKRLHLFGKHYEGYLDVVRFHCSLNNVEVTVEEDN